MQTPIIIGIAILALIVLYVIFQGAWKSKGDDKLINRNIAPLDTDDKKAGGGTPKDTYSGTNP